MTMAKTTDIRKHPIQCPYCGQKHGYDLVDHLESEDEVIKDQYHCPKCGRDAIRIYHFNRWEMTPDTKLGK
jgi:ribosomal protein S27AE